MLCNIFDLRKDAIRRGSTAHHDLYIAIDLTICVSPMTVRGDRTWCLYARAAG
ncbi:MAG: hypothetical protein F6J93_22795 [Oscillatoria sp. SIO1A7]|nr:hypothetical protein [Oscillatoria sp. SIO1A7]